MCDERDQSHGRPDNTRDSLSRSEHDGERQERNGIPESYDTHDPEHAAVEGHQPGATLPRTARYVAVTTRWIYDESPRA